MATQDATARSWRAVWIAPLVLLAGLAATIAISYAMKAHEQREVGWATKLAADAIRIDLTTDVQWQLYGLDRLALLWESVGPQQGLWKKNAELYIQHRPGTIAVEWISTPDKQRTVIYAAGNEGAVLAFGGLPESLMAAAAKSKVAMFSGTVNVAGGSKQWAIAYPVFAGARLRGFVISFFDFDKSLGYIVDDLRPLDFAFEVSQGEDHLYLKPGSSRKHEEQWATTAEISLPGGNWSVRVWPAPSVVDRIKSRLPEATLFGGSLVSLLLAFIVHLLVKSSRASKHIQAINNELTREIQRRKDAQEELVKAHEQLELRVAERTAELAKANTLLENEIEEHQKAVQSLRELNGRLFQLQDEERRRLARELHDGATQELVALSLNVESFRELAKNPENQQTLNECVRLIQQCTTELRTISYLLHPPFFDELGLVPALRHYVEGFSRRSGIQINLEIEQHLGRLGHDVELTVFRVVQEALANVHRHSRSRTATVLLYREAGTLKLEIVDEGRGISAELLERVKAGVAGIGTSGMRERVRLLGGQFEITSDGAGTCIRALVPTSQTGVGQVETSVA